MCVCVCVCVCSFPNVLTSSCPILFNPHPCPVKLCSLASSRTVPRRPSRSLPRPAPPQTMLFPLPAVLFPCPKAVSSPGCPVTAPPSICASACLLPPQALRYRFPCPDLARPLLISFSSNYLPLVSRPMPDPVSALVHPCPAPCPITSPLSWGGRTVPIPLLCLFRARFDLV